MTAAAGQFDHLGASDWAAKARQELARLAGRRPTQGLTETERQIARLAATGSTNREIADRVPGSGSDHRVSRAAI